jgi:hypothetical protein
MFDYMRSKNGNIIAVVDRKESIVQYLKPKKFPLLLLRRMEVCQRKV